MQGINNRNTVILEQDSENNDEESCYVSHSPPRRGKSNQKTLLLNPSNLAIENAGNQQHSPTSAGMVLNKMGMNKKSNAHLNVNGTLGTTTHGYGPITNNMLSMMP